MFDRPFRTSFPSTFRFVAGVMGRRAKNKQGDPLPLHADPDLNGSSTTPKLKPKPGLKGRPSAPNLNPKLGKRKPERDDDGERVTKKPKGVRPSGKTRPPAKAASSKSNGKSKGKEAVFEGDEATDDGGSVGWGGAEDIDMRTEARCVCPLGV